METTKARPWPTHIENLVIANRILGTYDVLDGFGHVSVRDPDNKNRYFLSRSRSPLLVEPEDIMLFDLESNAVPSDDKRKPYLERFIHGEIYRKRPDVQAIVHSHAPSVVPFAASDVALKPIFHMAGFLSSGVPVFDMHQHFGDTDLLVTNNDHGRVLADVLGNAAVALMRGHGFVAVASSIESAVYRAMYTQQNAELQEKAINLGGSITYLYPKEGELADTTISSVIQRPWELWKTACGY